MTWRMRRVSVLLRGKAIGSASAVRGSAIVAAVLVAGCLALLLTAPVNGDFWWADAPRHALNGAFVRDFVAAHPINQPVQWAIDYYLRRPALTIMFYPPLFYAAEAITFALAGVSHFVAQFTVSLFALLLGVSSYILARTVLPRWSALGAALLVIGTPETAFWGRQVMLDVPAYALVAAGAACLAGYVTEARPVTIYAAALFVLAAIYTKYNAGFIAPALAVGFVVAKGRAVLRDRHVWIAAGITVIGVLPAIAILLRFGAQNLASMSGLQGTLPLDSLACWLFYLQTLPAQIGWLTTVLATGGVVLIMKRAGSGKDRWAYALLLAWLAVGYLFFSLISLKEPRDTVMVLLPLAIAAPLFLLVVLPRKLGEPAGLALGIGTLLYTLIFCPVPRVAGYQDIAIYLAKTVPHDGVVLYSGYRDGNLIFDLATITNRSDITVVRVDKLLLSAPVGERRRGIKQADYDEAAIARMLRNLGAAYFVVQPGFWSDLAVMGRFANVVKSSDYVKAAHFDLTGDLSTQDGDQGIDILRPTYPVAPKSGRISIDMPLAGQRFEGTTHP
jgi:Dolichyl-phosphate-mannose-protein mannosyltransferase